MQSLWIFSRCNAFAALSCNYVTLASLCNVALFRQISLGIPLECGVPDFYIGQLTFLATQQWNHIQYHIFLFFFVVLFNSNDIEEHLEETAAEAEPEPEPEPEQEPEPEAQEEKSEPVLEESAPEETVEKSPSPAPADPAPAVQEDSRVMTVDGCFLCCGGFISMFDSSVILQSVIVSLARGTICGIRSVQCFVIFFFPLCPNYSSRVQLPPSH